MEMSDSSEGGTSSDSDSGTRSNGGGGSDGGGSDGSGGGGIARDVDGPAAPSAPTVAAPAPAAPVAGFATAAAAAAVPAETWIDNVNLCADMYEAMKIGDQVRVRGAVKDGTTSLNTQVGGSVTAL